MAKNAWQFCTFAFLLIVLIALSGVSLYLLWHIYDTTDDIDDKLSDKTTTTFPPMTTTTGAHNVSHSKGWKDAAKIMKAGLNESVNPCDDFFQFSCGGWIAAHPLRPEQQATDVFTLTLIEVINIVKDEIAKINNSSLKIMQAAKNYYTSCVQSSFMETANRDALVDTITNDKKFIGFPMIMSEWKSPGWKKLWKFMAQSPVYTQANVAYTRVQYINPFYAGDIDAYKKFIIGAGYLLAKQANQSVSEAQIIADANDLVAFETKLAYISRSNDDQKNFSRTYNPFELSRMQARWAGIDWDTYYNTFFKGGMPRRPVVINQPAYIDALNGLILDHMQNSKSEVFERTVANFINWRFIYDNSEFLNDDEFSKIFLDYRNALYGVESLPPSDLMCTYKLTDTFLPLPTGRLYVDYRMKLENLTDIRESVKQQMDSIVKAFVKRVENLDWMDESSKANALEKANNLVENVGYPDWILDDKKLESAFTAYSEGLTDGTGSAFWSNVQFVKRQQMLDQIKQLDEPVNRHSFGQGPTAVNAWYQPRVNSITFALAILQSPFWRYDFPQAINYGDQGGTAGHELTHGYDDSGVQFFTNGTLYTWVDGKSLAGFETMAQVPLIHTGKCPGKWVRECPQCIIGQYSSHCCPKGVRGMCANGMATQGENIADVGGQAAAYDAYIDYVENTLGHEEPRMPGLEKYSMRQMFWISYAHTWCGIYRPEALVQQLLTDPHAPDTCRTNLVLRDLPQFGKDFNCNYGVDFMYPKKEEICVVW